jgi:hypothetical protein
VWRCCLNPRVILTLAGIGLLLWLYAPAAGAGALPALILLICPLSMAVMAWRMRRGGSCSTPSGAAPTAGAVDAELRELSEELAILRARRRLATKSDVDKS